MKPKPFHPNDGLYGHFGMYLARNFRLRQSERPKKLMEDGYQLIPKVETEEIEVIEDSDERIHSLNTRERKDGRRSVRY